MSKQAFDFTVDFIVDRLSCKGTFRILKTRLPECDPGVEVKLSKWCEALVRKIIEERIPGRFNRITPRVIKRKMSDGTTVAPNIESRETDENH